MNCFEMTDAEFHEYILECNRKQAEAWKAVPDVYEGTVYFFHVYEKRAYGFEGGLVSTTLLESSEEEEVTLEGTFVGKVTGEIARHLNKDGSIGYGRGE